MEREEARLGDHERVWTTAAFVGLFGDLFTADTEAQGGHIEPSITSVVDVLGRMDSMPELTGLPETRKADLVAIRDIFAQAGSVGAQTMASTMRTGTRDAKKEPLAEDESATKVAELLKRITCSIRGLRPGGIIGFPSGWSDKKGGHAVFLLVERTSPDECAVTICNTGQGVNSHPSAGDQVSEPDRFRTGLTLPGIPLDRVCDPSVWLLLCQLRNSPKDTNQPGAMYEVILPHLCGRPMEEAIKAGYGMHGPLATLQRSGTCYFKCVQAALKYLMHRKGFTEAERKLVTYALRVAYMEVVERQLAVGLSAAETPAAETASDEADAASCAAAPATSQGGAIVRSKDGSDSATARMEAAAATGFVLLPHEIKMIDIGCRQTANAALKESKRGTLDKAGMLRLHHLLMRVQTHMAAADAKGALLDTGAPEELQAVSAASAAAASADIDFPDGAAPPPLALDSIGAVVDSFPGFGLLADQRSTDVFAGAETTKPTDLFTDLVEASDVEAVETLAKSPDTASGAGAAAASPARVSAVTSGEAGAGRRLFPPADFEALRLLLRRTLRRCNKLQQKSQSSTGAIPMLQLLAHLEALFLRRLPVPEAWSELTPARAHIAKTKGPDALPEAERAALLWEPVSLDRVAQLEVMDILNKLLLLQVAAAKSVPYAREAFARNLLTSCAIGACLQHMLLLRASPLPLPLTTVMLEGVSDVNVAKDSGALIDDSPAGPGRGAPPVSEDEMIAAAVRESLKDGSPPAADADGPALAADESASAGDEAAAIAAATATSTDGSDEIPFAVFPTAPHFHMVMADGADRELGELLECALITDPSVAAARAKLLRYWAASAKHGQPILSFAPSSAGGRGFPMDASKAEFKLMLKLLEMTGHRFDLPPHTTRTNSDGDDPTDVERAYRWLCTSEFDECGELAIVRTLTTTLRLAAAYDPLQSSFEEKLWPASQMRLALAVDRVQGGDQQAVANINAFVASRPLAVLAMAEPLPTFATDPRHHLSMPLTGPAATENEIRRAAEIPTFDDTLSWQDSEHFLCCMSAPYLQIPLVLRFFAADRLGALFNERVRLVVERMLFEPRAFFDERPLADSGREVVPVAPLQGPSRVLLGTRHGLLYNELCHAAAGSVSPMLRIGHQVADLCAGEYTSSFVGMLLYIVRVISRTEGFLVDVVDSGAARAVSEDAHTEAEQQLERLRLFLRGPARQKLFMYILQTQKSSSDEAIRAGTQLHAHHALIFANSRPHELDHVTARAFMASASYVIAWYVQESAAASSKPRAGRRMRGMFGRRGGEDPATARLRESDGATPFVPATDLFAAIERLRPAVLHLVRTGTAEQRDDLLQAILATSSRAPMAVSRNWEVASRAAFHCSVTRESSHPYPAGAGVFETIEFPGAPYITVTFDALTTTERDTDFVCIYKDETCTSTWGAPSYSGKPDKFPGATSKKPLVVPSDKCVFHFHSDNQSAAYGYNVTFEAPIDVDAASKLALEDRTDGEAGKWPLRWCQRAVAQSLNDVAAARELLHSQAAEFAEWQRTQAAEATASDMNGLFRNASGSIEVDLQTGEVYFRNRLRMPTPGALTSQQEFRAVFGRTTPLCSRDQERESMSVYEIMAEDHKYSVATWSKQLPPPIEARRVLSKVAERGELDALLAIGSKQAEIVVPWRRGSVLIGETAWNMPVHGKAECWWAGRKFSEEYEEELCGWAGPIVEQAMDEAAKLMQKALKTENTAGEMGESDSDKHAKLDCTLFMEDGLQSRLEADTAALDPSGIGRAADTIVPAELPPAGGMPVEDAAGRRHVVGSILMFLAPQASTKDEQATKPGRWFEIEICSGRRIVQCFEISSIARRAMRNCVYSSDRRFCLASLEPSTEDRDGPPHPLAKHSAGQMAGGALAEAKAQAERGGMRMYGFRREDVLDDEETQMSIDTVEITREQLGGAAEGVFPRFPETFCTPATLQGLLPQALLEAYDFWRSAKPGDAAGVMIRGYPKRDSERAQNTYIVVDVMAKAYRRGPTTSSADAGASASAAASGSGGGLGGAADIEAPLHVVEGEAVVRRYTEDALKQSMAGVAPSRGVQTLLNVARAPRGSPLYRIAQLLSRVETMSHVLVWTDADARVGEEAPISSIELPRLATGFRPKSAGHGPTASYRLFSSDFGSMFVSDARSHSLIRHLRCAPHSLVLGNSTGESFIFVPLMSVHNPAVKSRPFSSDIVLTHGDGLAAAAKSRFFVYSVHPSGAYIVTPTTGAALYWAVLSMMTRDYERVCKLIPACRTDVPFSTEEAWIFKMLTRTAGDSHPDAHAARLRLAAVELEASSAATTSIFDAKEVDKDHKNYLKKLSSVSAFARMAASEEQDLLQTMFRGSSRLGFLVQVMSLQEQQARLDAEFEAKLASWRAMRDGALGRKATPEGATEAGQEEGIAGAVSLTRVKSVLGGDDEVDDLEEDAIPGMPAPAGPDSTAAPAKGDVSTPSVELVASRSHEGSAGPVVDMRKVTTVLGKVRVGSGSTGGAGNSATVHRVVRVHVPGASRLELLFTANSRLAEGEEIRVFADEACTEELTSGPLTGQAVPAPSLGAAASGAIMAIVSTMTSAASGESHPAWPGAGALAHPLEAPGDTAYVVFRSSKPVTGTGDGALTTDEVSAEAVADSATGAHAKDLKRVVATATPADDGPRSMLRGAAQAAAAGFWRATVIGYGSLDAQATATARAASRMAASGTGGDAAAAAAASDAAGLTHGALLTGAPSLTRSHSTKHGPTGNPAADLREASEAVELAPHLPPRPEREVLALTLPSVIESAAGGGSALPSLLSLPRLFTDMVSQDTVAVAATIRYRRPDASQVSGGGWQGIVSELWKDADESLSGRMKQLGFGFLYELARGDVDFSLVGDRAAERSADAVSAEVVREASRAAATASAAASAASPSALGATPSQIAVSRNSALSEAMQAKDAAEAAMRQAADDAPPVMCHSRSNAAMARLIGAILVFHSQEWKASGSPFLSVLSAMAAAEEMDRARARHGHTGPWLLDAFPRLPVEAHKEAFSTQGITMRGGLGASIFTRMVVAGFAVTQPVEYALRYSRPLPPAPSELSTPIPLSLSSDDVLGARPEVSDFSCGRRVLRPVSAEESPGARRFGVNMSAASVHSFARAPLAGLGLGVGGIDDASGAPGEPTHLVRMPASGNVHHARGKLDTKLPFSVERAPEAASSLGKELLERLETDMRDSSRAREKAMAWRISYLEDSVMEVLRSSLLCVDEPDGTTRPRTEERCGFTEVAAQAVRHAIARLAAMRATLAACRDADAVAVEEGISSLTKGANDVPLEEDAEDAEERLRFIFSRREGGRTRLWFEYMSAALLTQRPRAALRSLNTFLSEDECSAALLAVVGIALRTSRLMQINRCLDSIDSLTGKVQDLAVSRLEAGWKFHAAAAPGVQVAPSSEMVRAALQADAFDPVAADARLARFEAAAAVLATSVGEGMGLGAAATAADAVVPARAAVLALVSTGFLTTGDPSSATELCSTKMANGGVTAVELLRKADRGCFHNGSSLPRIPQPMALLADGSGDMLACSALDTTTPGDAAPAHVDTAGFSGASSQAGLARELKSMEAQLFLLEKTADQVASSIATRRHFMAEAAAARAALGNIPSALAGAGIHAAAATLAAMVSAPSSDTMAAAAALSATPSAAFESDLTSRRSGSKSSMADDDDAEYVFDPRLLVFEFMSGFVLRKRQVQITAEFAHAALRGDSAIKAMQMGLGKTSVVAPLLALLLADGDTLVTAVMPAPLLQQSRLQFRLIFSSLIPKRILTFRFDRESTEYFPRGGAYSSGQDKLEGLVLKMDRARRDRAVVCTTPDALKSFMLKYVDILQEVENAPAWTLVDKATLEGGELASRSLATEHTAAVSRLRSLSKKADCMRDMFKLWNSAADGGNGVLLLDEVDLLLHSLKSETNFPIGPKERLDMSPSRWDFPMFLLEAIFYHTTRRVTSSGMRMTPEADAVVAELATVIDAGIADFSLQSSPHLVLLSQAFYHARMKPLLAHWALLWLRSKQRELVEVPADPSDPESKPKWEVVGFFPLQSLAATSLDADDVAAAGASAAKDAGASTDLLELSDEATAHIVSYMSGANTLTHPCAAWLESRCDSKALKCLNLAREWLSTLMPHCLSKIDRVSCGLLWPHHMSKVVGGDTNSVPRSRKLLAVPFVGKDVPSRASEYSHPDILIGLSVLAYRYEGLRFGDMGQIMQLLKKSFSNESGSAEERPSRIQFQRWLDGSHARAMAAKSAKASHTDSGSETSLVDGTDHSVARDVLPLELFQPSEEAQMQRCYEALRFSPEVAAFYLENTVFPSTMQHQRTKLAASGIDLGSDMLFARRLGFSGTPSNLLPTGLTCEFEPGSEASIVRLLTSPSLVSVKQLGSWSVESLLREVATAEPQFLGLIDTGALVTGMTNEEVARFLLANGLKGLDGCVFLGNDDKPRCVLRSTGRAIALEQCGLPWHKRFTFWDQVHTTGVDIKQALDARSAVTIGKDMTLRDYAQGCWRMRGLKTGQKLTALVVPEVLQLVHAVSSTSSSASDIVAWLAVNGIRSEQLQQMALAVQNLSFVWRKQAFRDIVASNMPRQAAGFGKPLVTRFHRLEDVQRMHPKAFGSSKAAAGGPNPISSQPSTLEPEAMMRMSESEQLAVAIRVSQRMAARQQEAEEAEARARSVSVAAEHAASMSRTPSEGAGLATAAAAAAAAGDIADADDSLSAADLRPSQLGREPSVLDEEALAQLVPGSASPLWLTRCIRVFREELNLSVEDCVRRPQPFVEVLRHHVDEQAALLQTPESRAMVELVLAKAGEAEADAMIRASDSAAATSERGDDEGAGSGALQEALAFDGEMVQEQEQEQEKEKEKEKEKQIQPNYASADSMIRQWSVRGLASRSALMGKLLYPASHLQTKSGHDPVMKVAPELIFSANWGSSIAPTNSVRCLNNIFVVADWTPPTKQAAFVPAVSAASGAASVVGDAAVKSEAENEAARIAAGELAPRRSVLVLTLGEAEALRRAMHTRHVALLRAGEDEEEQGGRAVVSLMTLDGEPLDWTPGSSKAAATAAAEDEDDAPAAPLARTRSAQEAQEAADRAGPPEPGSADAVAVARQAARFFNLDVWFSESDLVDLLRSAAATPSGDRLSVWMDLQMSLRRDKLSWEDTALAAFFTHGDATEVILMQKAAARVCSALIARSGALRAAFLALDDAGEGFLSLTQMEDAIKALRLDGLKPPTIRSLVVTADTNGDGYIDYREFMQRFAPPSASSNSQAAAEDEEAQTAVQRMAAFFAQLDEESRQRVIRAARRDTTGVATALTEAIRAVDGDASASNRRQKPANGSGGTLTDHLNAADVIRMGMLFVSSGGAATIEGRSIISTTGDHYPTIMPRSAGSAVSDKLGGSYVEITVLDLPEGGRPHPLRALPAGGAQPAKSRRSRPACFGVVTGGFTGNSKRGVGVGGTSNSWAITAEGNLLHDGVERPSGLGRALRPGDVVGIRFHAADRTIAFYINGEQPVAPDAPGAAAARALGVTCGFADAAPQMLGHGSFEKEGSLSPACTIDAGTLVNFNVGATPFRRRPPTATLSFQRTIERSREIKVFMDAGRMAGRILPTSGAGGIRIQGMSLDWVSGFPSAVLSGCLLTRGKWYYEVRCSRRRMASQLGWADMAFAGSSAGGQGVGDDKNSWAYDGERQVKWHNGSIPFGRPWYPGDVIGFAIDMDSREMQFSINGAFSRPNGVAWSNFECEGGITPGFTLQGSTFTVNFGQTVFKHPGGPTGKYRSLWSWFQERLPALARVTGGMLPHSIVKTPAFDYHVDRESVLAATRSAMREAHVGATPSSLAATAEVTVGDIASGPSDAVYGLSNVPAAESGGSDLDHAPALRRGASTQHTPADPSRLETVPLRVLSGFEVSVLEGADGPAPQWSPRAHTPTVVGDALSLTSGKWYYEVRITNVGPAWIGWSDELFFPNWARDEVTGATANSWAFAIDEAVAMSGGKRKPFGRRVRTGVVGCALDLDAGTMSFSHNGSFADGFGVAFEGISLMDGAALRPTVTGQASLAAEFLFSASVQSYAPPDASYRPVADALPLLQARLEAEAAGGDAAADDVAGAAESLGVVVAGVHSAAEAADDAMAVAKAEAGAAAGRMVPMAGHEECIFVDGTRLVYLQELPTARLAGCALTRGKWCFSVRVLQAGGGTFIGWAREGFSADVTSSGAGQDEHSWAVDGDSRLKWHNNVSEPCGRGWDSGDVVGCAIDVDEGRIFYGVNGSWAEAAFSGVRAGAGGVFPVITLRDSGVEVVLGGSSGYAISSTGPDGTFAPLGTAFE